MVVKTVHVGRVEASSYAYRSPEPPSREPLPFRLTILSLMPGPGFSVLTRLVLSLLVSLEFFRYVGELCV